jgi:hypothetical protein
VIPWITRSTGRRDGDTTPNDALTFESTCALRTATYSTPGPPDDIDDTDGFTDAALTAEERRELLRHRCLVPAPVNAAELGGTPGRETDPSPFDGPPGTSGT